MSHSKNRKGRTRLPSLPQPMLNYLAGASAGAAAAAAALAFLALWAFLAFLTFFALGAAASAAGAGAAAVAAGAASAAGAAGAAAKAEAANRPAIKAASRDFICSPSYMLMNGDSCESLAITAASVARLTALDNIQYRQNTIDVEEPLGMAHPLSAASRSRHRGGPVPLASMPTGI